MSFWSNIVRYMDRLLGEPLPPEPEVDPVKIDEAIRIIQEHVDAERRARKIALLRIEDLGPEAQARLATDLARVFGDPDGAPLSPEQLQRLRQALGEDNRQVA